VAPESRDESQKSDLLEFFASRDEEYRKRRIELANASKPLPPDAKLVELQNYLAEVSRPVPEDSKLVQLRHDVEYSTKQLDNKRLTGVQDLAWALINSPAFLFNH
jgi:hypothetical protein